MYSRYLLVGSLFLLGGCPLLYFSIGFGFKGPFPVVLFLYFLVFATLGNAYLWNGETNTLRDLFYLGGALLFISVALQFLMQSAVIGLRIGSELFPRFTEIYENSSIPRLITWLGSGLLFLLTAVLMLFRRKYILAVMSLGTLLFLFGLTYDFYVFERDAYDNVFVLELFLVGTGLVVWALATAILLLKGILQPSQNP